MDTQEDKELQEAIRVVVNSKPHRNKKGGQAQQFSITLPAKTAEILVRHARKFNISISRMAHDIIIDWYCYREGLHIDK